MLLAFVVAAALGSSPAEPASTPAEKSQAPLNAPPAAPDADKLVCRRAAVTGSRLGGDEVCLTKAQWAERQRSDSETLRAVQSRATQLRPQ